MRAAARQPMNAGRRLGRANEVDYARGGGSSGALVSAGGASNTSCSGALPAGTNDAITVDATVTAAGAHGAIVWQPFGAHGNRQGDSCWSCCAGAEGG
jgi:hypothetical protein